MPLQFSDPVVGPALITAIGIVAAAVVTAVGQIICTWLQTRSKKPLSRKPKPKGKKRRRWTPSQVRPPPTPGLRSTAPTERPLPRPLWALGYGVPAQ